MTLPIHFVLGLLYSQNRGGLTLDDICHCIYKLEKKKVRTGYLPWIGNNAIEWVSIFSTVRDEIMNLMYFYFDGPMVRQVPPEDVDDMIFSLRDQRYDLTYQGTRLFEEEMRHIAHHEIEALKEVVV